MVEMLGVLAIIGVLSVGAIAGYSQAMTKHKLNKQAEQLSWMLNILHQYKSQWVFPGQQFVQLVPYYKKLGLIPEDMIKDDTHFIYDAFNLKIAIKTNACEESGCRSVIIQYYTANDHLMFEICQNFFTAAKAFHEQLEAFDTWSVDQGSKYTYYGDKYCKGSMKCLKNIDMDQIYEVCENINNGMKFQPYFSFKIQD